MMKLLLDLQGMQTESRFRGIGRQAHEFARAVIRQATNCDVHILLNRRLGEGLEEVVAEFEQLLTESRIHIFDVPGPTAERHPDNLWRTIAAEHVREAKIAQIKPDVLHIASLFEGFVDDAVTSIGRFDVPYATAVTLHDLIPLADPRRYLGQEGPRRHWLRRAQYLKRADLLLSVSEYSAFEATKRLSIGPDRICVIGGGVDARFCPVEENSIENADLLSRFGLEQPFYLYVGAIDPRKNVELIFSAFSELPENLRRERLIVFVGRLFEEEVGRLKVEAARFDIPVARLRFCQQVSDHDLVNLYRLAEAFIFPSLHEGFGLPALEAMACGTPTLVADATALKEVVRDSALRFDPHDPQSLAECLIRLATDPAFGSAARASGLARAREFTWDGAATRALDAFARVHSRRTESKTIIDGVALSRKPLMAFFSPLPADKSGVADYSAELLPELARFYEIECVVTNETTVQDEWILANFVVRDYGFFERNAWRYDRIVYSVGNSHFHQGMLDLLERFPGIVILHDFYLSDLIEWMSSTGVWPYEQFHRELYRTHGLAALAFERSKGRLAAVTRYPCNAAVFQRATGIIVHSQYLIERAKQLYGEMITSKMAVVPHLRVLRDLPSRSAARACLGVGESDLLVVSFGVVTARKCGDLLIDAWEVSEAGRKEAARLVFVGELGDGAFGATMRGRLSACRNAEATGYASVDTYRAYLAAADLAVQLRMESRGETSGTILDCLGAKLPLIVNDHGTTAELPFHLALRVPERVTAEQLANAIDSLVGWPAMAAERAEDGYRHLECTSNPERVGGEMHEAIERFESSLDRQVQRNLYSALGDFTAPVSPTSEDVSQLAAALGQSSPRIGQRQILYDITVLAEKDARTGIQRVVRAILAQLINNPPLGFRIEPVRMDGSIIRYARKWVADNLELPAWVFPDDPVDADAGDVYVSIDWVPDRLPNVEGWLARLRGVGGRVVIGVHDLLPLQLPQFFPDFMPEVSRRWFEVALRVADQFLCVSRAVADDVVKFGRALRSDDTDRTISVDFFHNAADLAASLPTTGRPDNAEEMLEQMAARPTFLMVGTVEPRKAHAQVLAGFDILWRRNVEANLVIVGKSGWMIDEISKRIKDHPELGNRLFWLSDISDEFLSAIYDGAAALVAASYGEGFGLPLIEAAWHQTPLIVRDIPVFREVAGDHASYFSGDRGEDIAAALCEWLTRWKSGAVPGSGGVKWQTWQQSAQQVASLILAETHYDAI